jgi:uncharacterized protein involved in outer membrane biogenesis
MKKWILIVCGTIVIIIIIILVAGLLNLGHLIKNAVNTYGPGMTKTEVRLGDVGISLLSGEVKLKDFLLGNPAGFTSPHALKVASVFVDLNESSLTGNTIVIDKIELVSPEIIYEKRRGTDNFKKILSNMQTPGGSDTSAKESSGNEEEGKKVLIKDFIVRNGKISLAMSMLGDKSINAQAKLPEIHLKDIGKENGGSSPTEVFKQVLASLYGGITSPAVLETLSKELKATGSDVLKLGKDTTKKGLEEASKKIKGLFGE